MAKKVVLAYSGGLDTSVAIRWLQEERGYDVVALTIDLGNEKDLQTVEQRALRDRRGQGDRPRRQAALHRLLRLPGADGRRRLRGPVPARHGDRPPADRQAARRCRARRRRDGDRARLHRQGQRPGALRRQHAGARARPRDRRAGARAPHEPRRADRVGGRARRPRAGDEGEPVQHRREPLGPQHRGRHARRSVGRAARGHLRLDEVASATRPTRRARSRSGSRTAGRSASTATRWTA